MIGMGVRVEGLQAVLRSLEKAGTEVSDLKAAFSKIGNKVADDAKANVNNLTGRLSSSITPSQAKSQAIVRAGSSRIPYAGVQEYGGYNNITPMAYLRDAVDENQNDSVRTLEDEINAMIRRLDLN